MKFGHLLTLRRSDGRSYLKRWGISCDLFGVYLHRMDAPDIGVDLHDHPWTFVSIVLRGGYVEERASVELAPAFAQLAERRPGDRPRGSEEVRHSFTAKTLGLDECHRITHLLAPTVWTLVLRGPVRSDRAGARSTWGFYMADGYIDERTYDETVRAERRDMWNEVGS